MSDWPYVVFAIVVLAGAAALAWQYRAMDSRHRRAREALVEAATALHTRLIESDHAEAAAIRRADAQFHCIEDACQERDAIWAMYREHVLGASAAQDLLWAEIERMRRFICVHAERHGFEVPPASDELLQVLGHYRARHRDESAAKDGVARAKAEIETRNRGLLGGTGQS